MGLEATLVQRRSYRIACDRCGKRAPPAWSVAGAGIEALKELYRQTYKAEWFCPECTALLTTVSQAS